MSIPRELEALIPVAEALEALGVFFYIGGSMASSVQGDALDRSYLQGWARKLGLADLLHRALQEAMRDGS